MRPAILRDSPPKANGCPLIDYASFALEHDSKIDQKRSQPVPVAPDHSETPLRIAAGNEKPNELNRETWLKPGANVIRWQTLALDGHITRGNGPFTVATVAPRAFSPTRAT